MNRNNNIHELTEQFPLIRPMSQGKEIFWNNDQLTDADSALKKLPFSASDIEDAEERWLRFAPFIKKAFPETEAADGMIESPLIEIPSMKNALNDSFHASLKGRLLLKMDSHLAAAGSVKARGGIYEILKHSEELALSEGMIRPGESYEAFCRPEFKKFFSRYSVHAGSTGNLGLSIGIISAALGYHVTIHMSMDAKEWKKKLLREKGVHVIEYASDYSEAVKAGRAQAEEDPMSYFVDDENSASLFLGYATAARRLKQQLDVMDIIVDRSHPLFVYLPCGVGGAPGGITFGLKQIFGGFVYCFFAEPVQAPCMALGVMTGLHDRICVQDIGLSGLTDADGLAVGRPSKFVGRQISSLLAGEFTVTDEHLYRYLRAFMDTEGMFIEPSSCAAFQGPAVLCSSPEGRQFLASHGLEQNMELAVHIAWATGGSLVPEEIRRQYYEKSQK